IAEGCRVNGTLDRVRILGATDTRLLNEAILPGSAILCDIEGHERDVIDPVKVPALKGAALLIELHEYYEPGVSALLKSRLAETHHITDITMQPRTKADLVYTPWWLGDPSFLLNERPTNDSWIWAVPKTI